MKALQRAPAAQYQVKRLPVSIPFNMLRNPLQSILRITREYGDMAEFRFGRYTVCVISHPDLIQEVLVSNHNHFVKSRTMQFGRKLMGKGLPASEGSFHRNQRRVIQPSFTHERVANYMRDAFTYANEAIDGWREGVPFEFREEMMRLTLSIAAKALFGTDIRSQAKETRSALVQSMEHFTIQYYLRVFYFNQDRNPFADFWETIPVGESRRYRAARISLDRTIEHLVAERRNDGTDHGDLLSTLLRSSDYEDETAPLSDSQVHDELMTFLLAAHDTTATALTWALYLLLNDRESWARVQREADEELHSATNGSEPRVRLEFAGRVIAESLRMYPPAWIIGRQAVDDCEVGGTRIRRGTTILMSQYALHHDSRFYPDPWTFKPDRWTPEMRTALPKYAYFPFGGGIRACIGEGFAKSMAALILATVALRWNLDLVPTPEVVPHARVTLHPRRGMVVVPRERNR
ncbi:MAG TPA: cytochrome P450 [Nitrososphaerales archaeon]|nr:cytochrome P450 [Nitrososphaerales archaeon]